MHPSNLTDPTKKVLLNAVLSFSNFLQGTNLPNKYRSFATLATPYIGSCSFVHIPCKLQKADIPFGIADRLHLS